jgi:hypothetical protein
MKSFSLTFRDLAPHLGALAGVALLVVLAVSQPTLGLLFVLLIPFWFLVCFVVLAFVPPPLELHKAPAFHALPVFSPRPPPAL